MGAFKEAHGGKLNELYLSEREADEEKIKAKDYRSWDLTQRQICDLDMLMNGAFSPLEGFLGKDDYEGVCDSMRLGSGVLWPMPITLDGTLRNGAMLCRLALEAKPLALHFSVTVECWRLP